MLLSESSHNTPPLKKFTFELLAQRSDLSYTADGFESRITWDGIEEDVTAVVQVFSELIQAALEKLRQLQLDSTVQLLCADLGLSDAQVSALLATAPFQAMISSDIRVTKGHRLVFPFFHQRNVYGSLTFSPHMTEQEVITVVLASHLHDLGKGLAAGVRDIDTQMAAHGSVHSHPNHAWISLFMTNALLDTAGFQEYLQKLHQEFQYSAENIHDLRLLIAYHHGFEDVFVEAGELRAHPGREADLRTLRELSPELVVLLYYFAFADMCSTVPYRQYWSVKQAFFAAWYAEQDWSAVALRVRNMARDALELKPELLTAP